MNGLEMFALAIATINEAMNPDSAAFKLSNPGMLHDFKGYKKYPSWKGGFHALLVDLEKIDRKLSLPEGLAKYGVREFEQEFLLYDFLSRACGKEIGRTTTLGEI